MSRLCISLHYRNTLWNHSTVIKRRMFEVLYSYRLFSVEVHVSTFVHAMTTFLSCSKYYIFLICFSLPRKHYQQQDKMDGFLRELQIPKDSPLTPLLSRIPRVRSSLVVVSCSTPCLVPLTPALHSSLLHLLTLVFLVHTTTSSL